jgi:hypothetical protein
LQTIEAKEKDYQKQVTYTATTKFIAAMQVAVGIVSHIKHT